MHHGKNRKDDPTGLEAQSREQREREKVEVIPKSAEVLLSASENAIEQIIEAVKTNSTAVEYLTALSERVLFYLQTEDGEPSIFAIAITKPESEISEADKVDIDRVK